MTGKAIPDGVLNLDAMFGVTRGVPPIEVGGKTFELKKLISQRDQERYYAAMNEGDPVAGFKVVLAKPADAAKLWEALQVAVDHTHFLEASAAITRHIFQIADESDEEDADPKD